MQRPPLEICRDSFCPCIFRSNYTRKGLQDRPLAGGGPLLSVYRHFPRQAGESAFHTIPARRDTDSIAYYSIWHRPLFLCFGFILHQTALCELGTVEVDERQRTAQQPAGGITHGDRNDRV